jgi:UTP--glucose-1-phosphate uridylyltransferase
MRAEGLPEIAIATFEHYYDQLAEGRTGMIPESTIVPADDVPDAETFEPRLAEIGKAAMKKAVLLKLNGGLGTSMGLEKAKSLLTIKEGMTFLDIIAKQALGGGVPLVLMNSFSTRDDTLAALEPYEGLRGKIPLDFLQNKIPKIAREDLSPAECSRDSSLEWCPPGHGDIYTALVTSGMLEKLLEGGYRYAFVSNADNLGAVIDPSLLGYFVENKLPFMMEVADRTEADKKGGHLAQRPDGQFLLRESAQCLPEDESTFQDITRHRYFNTNNLWIDLVALRELMTRRKNILGLAMICNSKTVDPRDGGSTPVFQLETAMGAAIEVFPGAGAVRVSKTRFAPIKKTNDLLDVRSDNYVLSEDFRVLANPKRSLGHALVDLDSAHYKFVDQLEKRFPFGPPSMLECERLVVKGDVRFGRNVVLKGEVSLVNESGAAVTLPDGEAVSGGRHW